VGAGCVVDHRDGQEHVLANIFALAYPYGHPSVMSSYYWQSSSTINTGDSMGPPSSNDSGVTWGVGLDAATRPVYGAGQVAGDVPANCSPTYENGKWTCEHRRTSTANMVKFRQVTAGEAVNNWQNIGGTPSDHIAFGLGDKGFVAINRTGAAAATTYTTAMAPGRYCNIVKYDYVPGTGCVLPGTATRAPADDTILVNGSGQIVSQALNSMDAFAIYSGGGPLAVTLASFDAAQQGDAVVVAWETVSELDNQSFNLYRAARAGGARVLLASIPSQAPGSTQGFAYT